MSAMKRSVLAVLAFVLLAAVPAAAQGQGHKKEFVIAPDRAISVTREVLVRQGYEVVRIETVGNDQIVYYPAATWVGAKARGSW